MQNNDHKPPPFDSKRTNNLGSKNLLETLYPKSLKTIHIPLRHTFNIPNKTLTTKTKEVDIETLLRLFITLPFNPYISS